MWRDGRVVSPVAAWSLVLVGVAAGCSPLDVRFLPGEGTWSVPVPAWAATPRYAIVNYGDDTISFVSGDPTQPALLGTRPIGDDPLYNEGPHHLASSPDGKYIYYNLTNAPATGNQIHSHGNGVDQGYLVRIDAVTAEKVPPEVTLRPNPGDVILSPGGETAYVTHFDRTAWTTHRLAPELSSGISTLIIADTATMKMIGGHLPLCPEGHGEALSRDGQTLYVACFASDQLIPVDVRDREHPVAGDPVRVGVIDSPSDEGNYEPYALSVSPSDGRVWVSNQLSSSLRVYDPVLRTMTTQILLHGRPFLGAFSRDGRTLYVAEQEPDELAIIDAAGDTLVSQVALPAGWCLRMHSVRILEPPHDDHALIVCEGNHAPFTVTPTPGTVVTVGLDPFTPIGVATVGLFPDGVPAPVPAAR